jgi:hypothetical protein
MLGAEELGTAVTLDAETEPDVAPDTDDRGKAGWVAAAAQNCCTSASAEATSKEQAVR